MYVAFYWYNRQSHGIRSGSVSGIGSGSVRTLFQLVSDRLAAWTGMDTDKDGHLGPVQVISLGLHYSHVTVDFDYSLQFRNPDVCVEREGTFRTSQLILCFSHVFFFVTAFAFLQTGPLN